MTRTNKTKTGKPHKARNANKPSEPTTTTIELRPDTDLRNKNLAGLDLSHANLQFANLLGAHMHHANLSHADLSGANVTKIQLHGADTTNTIMPPNWQDVADMRPEDPA